MQAARNGVKINVSCPWLWAALEHRFPKLLGRSEAPVATGGIRGLSPQNKVTSLPNWNVKHYNSVEFRHFLQFQAPWANIKPPCWKLPGDVSVLRYIRVLAHFVFMRNPRNDASPLKLPSVRHNPSCDECACDAEENRMRKESLVKKTYSQGKIERHLYFR